MRYASFWACLQQVYLHKEAGYSMGYARKDSTPREEGAHVSPGAVGALFLCSVVVGEVPPIMGESDMKDPGAKKTGCITARGSEGMLIVFKDFQAIPKYLLSIGTFCSPGIYCTSDVMHR